jgi:hypothetical protein
MDQMENCQMTVPDILAQISLDGLIRIDAALEGDWSGTVATVWTREKGRLGFDAVAGPHPAFRPSLELCFTGSWVGIHCFFVSDGQNVFNEPFARDIVDYIEYQLRKKDDRR